ncbi:hypothetical protein [Pseudoalteromonas rubra]|nr:hypothetical protein [Pseudoalteromonas rubra]
MNKVVCNTADVTLFALCIGGGSLLPDGLIPGMAGFILIKVILPVLLCVVLRYLFFKSVSVSCDKPTCNGKGVLESETELVDNPVIRAVMIKGHRCTKCQHLIQTTLVGPATKNNQ